jgi:ATP-binding cassette, subfamily B, bacterial MsbA
MGIEGTGGLKPALGWGGIRACGDCGGNGISGPPVKQILPFYRHLRPVRWQFLLGVAFGLVYSAASGAGLPLLTKIVFPVLFDKGSEIGRKYEGWLSGIVGEVSRDHLLLLTCLWIPFIFITRAFAGYANSYLIHYAGLRAVESIRVDLFTKLQSLPLSFFKRNRSGDLLARLMGDTEVLRQVLAQCSSDLIKQPATLVFAMGTLTYLAVRDRSFFIALIALVSVPLCVTVIRAAGKRLTAKARSLQIRSGDLTAALTESLQSSLEIRAYNLEERQISRFRERIAAMIRVSMKVIKYRQAISPSIEVVASTGFAAALFFGVRSGMTLEGFMTLGVALYMSYEPVKKLGAIHSQFRQGEAAIERLNFILHEPDTLPDPAAPKPCAVPRGTIRFENVSFAYEDGEHVLNEVSVDIPIGKVIALIGPSGAGKSTFASLIPRFHDPRSGRITIDGTDLRDFAKKDLRSRIAVVPQTPSLFAGTVMENIRIGRLDAGDDEVREAARRAHADEFIRTLADGYRTQVGERGDQLSGGQRQRIAIARAFLRNAPILILDEATSALDAEGEAMVQQALAELVKGRTTLVIAHRFSTITIADRIMVFQNGRIAADGTHDELRGRNAIYQAMMGGALSPGFGAIDQDGAAAIAAPVC